MPHAEQVMTKATFSSELTRSCTDLVILTVLSRQPMHGYDILVSMANLGDGQFRVKQGTLYPVLYRLEREGWIQGKWHEPKTGKKRKVYSITADGSRERKQRLEQWKSFTTSVNSILAEPTHD